MTTPLDPGRWTAQAHYRDYPAAELQPLLSGTASVLSWHAVGFSGEHPFAAFSRHLPADMRRVSGKRITEFLAGRYCAERALTAAGGGSGRWLPRGDDRLPVWPQGWTGSISHVDGIAAVAVAAGAPGQVLGLDIERWIGSGLAEQIRGMIATPDELSLLSMLPPERALTLLFSAKEALFKALYPQVGRFMEFSSARVVEAGDSELQLRLSEHWSLTWPLGTVVPVRFLLRDTYVSTAVSGCAGMITSGSV